MRHSLATARPNSHATITGFDAAMDPAIVRRLGELGFRPGKRVEVLRRAPLSGPVVCRIACTEICLRRDQASCILLDLIEPDHAAGAHLN